MVEGDEWKQEVKEPNMSGFYHLRQYLLERVTNSTNYYSSFSDVVSTFKPKRVPSKLWRTSCIDELIDGYVNSDHVFTSINYHNIPRNKFLQVQSAYERGLDYCLRHGEWPEEAVKWVAVNVKKVKLDDGN